MNESLTIVKQEEKDLPPPPNIQTNVTHWLINRKNKYQNCSFRILKFVCCYYNFQVKKVISFDPEVLKLQNNSNSNASCMLTNNNNTVNFTTQMNLQSPMNLNQNSPSNQGDGFNNQDDKLLLQYSVKDNIIDFSSHSDKWYFDDKEDKN